MNLMLLVYTAPLLVGGMITLALSFYGWHRRRIAGGLTFAVVMLAVSQESFSYAAIMLSPDLPAKIVWNAIEWIGVPLVPTGLLVFVLHYKGFKSWLTWRRQVALWSVPLLCIALAWTNDAHHLLFGGITLSTSGPVATLVIAKGPAYWAFVAYAWPATMIAAVLLVRTLWSARRVYRRQAVTLAISVAMPLAANVIYQARLGPFADLDFTPFAYAFSGIGFAWSLLRYRFMDLVPIAHDAVFAGMRDAVIVLDVQNRVVDVNPAAERVLARNASQLVGVPAEQVFGKRPDLVEAYVEVMEAAVEITLGEASNVLDYELWISPLSDRGGAPAGRLLVLRDITDRKRAEAALAYQALHDALTGLPNRTLLNDRLQRAVLTHNGERSSMALLLLDLDGFKEVNDSLGHQSGDAVLQQVAERLRSSVRASDTVARLGGDEFALLLPDADAAGAERCVLGCLAALSQPFEIDGERLQVGGSFGVALLPSNGRDARTLMRNADMAMYAAKRAGVGFAVSHAGPESYLVAGQAPHRQRAATRWAQGLVSTQAQHVQHVQPFLGRHASN